MENKTLAKTENQLLSASERFTNMVMKEFGSSTISIKGMDDYHKRLCQSYFIGLDSILKTNEIKRDDKKNALPFIWDNVNLQQLARDIITFTSIGLDPALPNHINMIPYKNSHTNKYDIGFIPGYRGIEIKAKKYGLDVPEHIIIELVFSNDKFRQIKKDAKNNVESYEFEIVDAFDRGELKGGFYYFKYEDETKNKCIVLNLHEIEKRKPKYASVEFWGGEKDKWEKDEKTGKSKIVGKEKIEGWFHEMCWKTIYRAAYNSITIDGSKIDQSFIRMEEIEEITNESIQENKLPEPASMTLPENKTKTETKSGPINIAVKEDLEKGTETKKESESGELKNKPNF